MDLFFSATSAADRGTLYHLKQSLNLRNVTKDINETFHHCDEMLEVNDIIVTFHHVTYISRV